MPQQKTSSLKTYFDEIEETKGDDECKAWLGRVLDSRDELESENTLGFFNLSFRFSFSDGPDAIIRFPKPGHTATAYRDEKVVNEAQIMEYLRQNTDIPIPRVHSWGLTAESPQHLGPFIIIDYTVLKQLDQEGVVLNPHIDNTTHWIRSIIKSPVTCFSSLNLRFLGSEPSQRTL
ncbi:hypothetical protein N7517_000779 [Penicillium concentricum]|uniref:Aminoglycoside phosphotransferase domain-containing protein n=1 Tax=Penicillium concentricum TaxID=293559 RepID=A0A9W9VHW7_9EURO|nr:uncharacterized protein N7517_000779 [Penicillium concentricum]KAJ5382868.1 hypothetical protein N7517_000779 [Penicillium concentricum]